MRKGGIWLGAVISLVLLLITSMNAAAVYIQKDKHKFTPPQHIHATIGADVGLIGSQCLYSDWVHNKGDTDTSFPFGNAFTWWHDADPGTEGWSKTLLLESGFPTGESVIIELDPWVGPCPT